ncbi:MAG: hypothetical protein QGF46_04000 [Planctomycetota bacterium]|nr:hypothetical protein [Planctomycetota bacterium]
MRLAQCTSLITVILFAFSCQAKPGNSISDLAAIHDQVTWQPISNPAIELQYQTSDHCELEEQILTDLGAVSPSQFSHAFELCSWSLVILQNDSNPRARRLAVALIGRLAGGWVENHGATLPPAGDGHLESAITLLAQATDGPSLEQAANAIIAAESPHVYGAIRILAAYGRIIHNIPVAEHRHPAITTAALRMVWVGLHASMLDSDSEVANSATATVNLIESYLAQN